MEHVEGEVHGREYKSREENESKLTESCGNRYLDMTLDTIGGIAKPAFGDTYETGRNQRC